MFISTVVNIPSEEGYLILDDPNTGWGFILFLSVITVMVGLVAVWILDNVVESDRKNKIARFAIAGVAITVISLVTFNKSNMLGSDAINRIEKEYNIEIYNSTDLFSTFFYNNKEFFKYPLIYKYNGEIRENIVFVDKKDIFEGGKYISSDIEIFAEPDIANPVPFGVCVPTLCSAISDEDRSIF